MSAAGSEEPTCQHTSSLKSNTSLFNMPSRLSTDCHADLRVPEVRIHTYSRCPTTAASACPGRSLCIDANAEIIISVIGKLHPPQGSSLEKSGGAERDRTDDLMLAKHALSQLSYSPELCSGLSPEKVAPSRMKSQRSTERMVGPGRFELPTSRLSSARSNQLSYEPRTLAPGRPALKPELNGVPPNHVFRLEEIRRRRCSFSDALCATSAR
jgi:hypothetical protein